jgi:hypothetical protein
VLAVITAIVATSSAGSPSEVVDGYRSALEVVTAVSLVGLAVILAGVLAGARRAWRPA